MCSSEIYSDVCVALSSHVPQALQPTASNLSPRLSAKHGFLLIFSVLCSCCVQWHYQNTKRRSCILAGKAWLTVGFSPQLSRLLCHDGNFLYYSQHPKTLDPISSRLTSATVLLAVISLGYGAWEVSSLPELVLSLSLPSAFLQRDLRMLPWKNMDGIVVFIWLCLSPCFLFQ